jgi:hypothetical protein
MVRVYRRDEYVVVEGEVVETGVGFTITYDFNHFKELFAKKSKEDKAMAKKYKEDQKKKKEAQKEAQKEADKKAAATQPADQPAQNKNNN